MAVCFQLKRDGVAVPLTQVDEEMCVAFGIPCDPVKWCRGWYDTVGFSIACGTTDEKFREVWADFPNVIELWDWVHEHFEPDNFYSR